MPLQGFRWIWLQWQLVLGESSCLCYLLLHEKVKERTTKTTKLTLLPHEQVIGISWYIILGVSLTRRTQSVNIINPTLVQRFPEKIFIENHEWNWMRFFLCWRWYCWWKKSCTSWYGNFPIIYGVSYMLGGCLGFLPSTVVLQNSGFIRVVKWDVSNPRNDTSKKNPMRNSNLRNLSGSPNPTSEFSFPIYTPEKLT